MVPTDLESMFSADLEQLTAMYFYTKVFSPKIAVFTRHPPYVLLCNTLNVWNTGTKQVTWVLHDCNQIEHWILGEIPLGRVLVGECCCCCCCFFFSNLPANTISTEVYETKPTVYAWNIRLKRKDFLKYCASTVAILIHREVHVKFKFINLV